MENPIRIDDLGIPLFSETFISSRGSPPKDPAGVLLISQAVCSYGNVMGLHGHPGGNRGVTLHGGHPRPCKFWDKLPGYQLVPVFFQLDWILCPGFGDLKNGGQIHGHPLKVGSWQRR